MNSKLSKTSSLKKVFTVKEVLQRKVKRIAFSGKMYDSFGNPEKIGVWIVWGQSASGKSDFVIQLAKALSQFGRVLYNSLEEGVSKSFQDKIKRHELNKNKIDIISADQKELNTYFSERPTRKYSTVIIDSLQYFGFTYNDYKNFKKEHADKAVVFVSHAEGKQPAGRVGKQVLYDAYMKIYVEGYKAFCIGREIGENGGEFTIWEQGAKKYWGNSKKSNKKNGNKIQNKPAIE